MKILRIFLLVLIIIGLILIFTQKIWVPRLVNEIVSRENTPIVISTNKPAPLLQDGRQCYTYSHEATKDEPYAVSEFIDININGKAVNGTKTGTQAGPDMTNGYSGTLTGTVDNDTINANFSYTIEGSSNKEQEIYKIRQDRIGIEKLRYPLIEKDKMLVPDVAKEFTTMLYARVGCTASN